jgi:hypothetical protein
MPTKWPSNEEQLFDSHFWADPADWPRDPPGYVFLGRAFDAIGRAVHGERWNQSVKEPDEPEEPPDDCGDEEFEEWERACDQADAHFRDLQAKVADMKGNLARMIAEQCELGNLVTAARPKRGGKMTELERYYWNLDDLRIRFFRCEMSLNRPFTAHRVSSSDCWIYVTQASLNHYLARQRSDGGASIQLEGDPIPTRATEPLALQSFVLPRAHRRHLAKKGLIELYGASGPGLGVTETRCHQDVDKWVRAHGEPKGVSLATVRRAKRDLRSTAGVIEPN